MAIGTEDWVLRAPGDLDRIEARFSGLAYAPHRHDTYAIGITLAGVQTSDGRCAGTGRKCGLQRRADRRDWVHRLALGVFPPVRVALEFQFQCVGSSAKLKFSGPAP
ncbi:MAG TPA: AraC family ligand binding domain-containing protein [Stellaceae bacterium]|nr:AraC family ligand binding domain-containing protein [Stellaceae bacterium]